MNLDERWWEMKVQKIESQETSIAKAIAKYNWSQWTLVVDDYDDDGDANANGFTKHQLFFSRRNNVYWRHGFEYQFLFALNITIDWIVLDSIAFIFP